MHLQKSVEPFDVFARALTIGPETMVMHFRPDEPMHDRYAVDHDFLSAVGRAGGDHDRPDGERLLPLGVQLLRDVDPGRHRAADRLRQRLSRRGGHLAALLLPLGDEGAGQVDRLLRGHRPPRPGCTWTPGPGSRSPTIPSWTTRPSWRAYQQLADDHFEKPRYLEFCAEALPDMDDLVLEWVGSADFDRMLERDHRRHLSRARAGPVPRPLPRPDRPVDRRRAGSAQRGDRLSPRPAGRRTRGARPGSRR